MTKNKIPFNKLDEALSKISQKSFIGNHIYINQSHLVTELLTKVKLFLMMIFIIYISLMIN